MAHGTKEFLSLSVEQPTDKNLSLSAPLGENSVQVMAGIVQNCLQLG